MRDARRTGGAIVLVGGIQMSSHDSAILFGDHKHKEAAAQLGSEIREG
jgi:hypothetical protein